MQRNLDGITWDAWLSSPGHKLAMECIDEDLQQEIIALQGPMQILASKADARLGHILLRHRLWTARELRDEMQLWAQDMHLYLSEHERVTAEIAKRQIYP